MHSIKHSKTAKVVAFATGLAMALTLFAGVGVNTASALTVDQVNSILGLLRSFGADQSTIDNVNSALTGTPVSGGASNGGSTPGSGFTFTRNLTVGDTGEDVRQLQIVLNGDSATQIAASGVGSAGNETTYFGGLTKAAVIKFQNKYASEVLAPVGLSVGTGFVGASTRAKLNTMTSGTGSTGSTGSTGGTTNPTPSGSGLTVESLPVGGGDFLTVPLNVSAMEFAKFKFTAGNQAVTVDEVRVVRSELGSKNDFDEVWITVNGTQKGNERSIVTGDFADFELGNDSFTIPAGQSVEVSILGSLSSSATAGHYNRLGFGSISANVAVNTSLPVRGPLTTISSQSATIVTLTAQGADKTISVGNSQTEIGRFKLDISSSADQDVVVKSLKLKNEGTSAALDTVIDNVALKVNGVVVSSSVALDGDYLMVSFDDYFMEDGQTQSFSILADVIAAEVNDTIQFQLDDDAHLVATEASSGTGVRVNGNDGTATTPANNVDLKTYTVETGDVNFAIGSASSRNVAPGLDDVILLDGTITVDSPIEADGIKARLNSSTDTDNDTVADIDANFENVTLRIDGVAIDTVDTLTNADGSGTAFVTGETSGDYYNFDSKFTLEAGEHAVIIEADVKTAATASDTIKLTIFSGDLDSPEYTVSGDSVPSAETTGQIDGSAVTIQAAALTFTRNDGFSSETLVGGVKGATLLKFTIDANDSSDAVINSLTFATDSSNTFVAANVTNLQLYVDGVKEGSPVDLTSGSITDANFTVPQSQQVQVELKGDLTTATTSQTLHIKLSTVDASDEEGNTITVSSDVVTSDTLSIETGGSFTLTVDGNTPDEDIIVGDGGSTWFPVARYRATAENEDIKITDLYFFNATTTNVASDGTATSTYADDRIQTLGVFVDGVQKAQKNLSSGAVQFDLGEEENPSGFGSIIVPKDDSIKIEVRAKINNIVDGDKTGRLLRLVLNPYAGKGDTGVVAQSTSVGTDLASSTIVAARDNDGSGGNGTIRGTSSIAADFFALRRSKPTITTASQGTDTVLTNGSNKVLYKFTVAADSAEDIAWKGIKFDVTGKLGTTTISTTTSAATFVDSTPGSTAGLTAATTSNDQNKITAFRLFESSTSQEVQNGDYSVQISWDGTNDNGEVAIVLDNGIEEVISQGSSKTYELRATVAGSTSNNGNFVDVTIDDQADDNPTSDSYFVTQTDPDNVDGVDTGSILMVASATSTSTYAPYSFLWSDFSGSPHSADNEITNADDRDWTNDRFISLDSTSWNRTASN